MEKVEKTKLDNNKRVQLLAEIVSNAGANIKLVGGAVIDILEGRVPKDYDVISISGSLDFQKGLIKNGFKYKWDTKTATTYSKNGVVVQVLKTSTQKFDFKISQAEYNLRNKTLKIDAISFNSKVLIPTSFTNKEMAWNSLYRIPKWLSKGYTISNTTYYSLLSVLNRGSISGTVNGSTDNS